MTLSISESSLTNLADDRVRAISLAMGLVPIIWTVANNVAFDTNGLFACMLVPDSSLIVFP